MSGDNQPSKTEDRKSSSHSENSISDDEIKSKGAFDDNLPSKTKDKYFLFYSVSSISDEELKHTGGKWILYLHNDLSELDRRWLVLQNLCNNGSLAAIKTSTLACSAYHTTICYTTDPANVKEVKYAADEIRKLVDYQFAMYYKASKLFKGPNGELERKEMFLYEHTMKGEFHKREMNYLKPSMVLWQFCTTYWGPSRKAEEGRQRDGTKTTITEETTKKSGNWELHSFGDLSKIDHRWELLQSLCESGLLTHIVSSTGACNQRRRVTKCFTSDSENTNEVKRAAEEIRNLIDYEYVMYYKTVEKATTESDFEIMYNARYMYTVKRGFYGKDKYMRWISLM